MDKYNFNAESSPIVYFYKFLGVINKGSSLSKKYNYFVLSGNSNFQRSYSNNTNNPINVFKLTRYLILVFKH